MADQFDRAQELDAMARAAAMAEHARKAASQPQLRPCGHCLNPACEEPFREPAKLFCNPGCEAEFRRRSVK